MQHIVNPDDHRSLQYVCAAPVAAMLCMHRLQVLLLLLVICLLDECDDLVRPRALCVDATVIGAP